MTTTEELIRRLAADPRPASPVARTLATRLSPALLAAFLLMALFWRIRPDLAAAYADPMVALKAILPALAAAAAIAATLRLARPEGRPGPAATALILLGLAAVALWLFGLARTPPEDWTAALKGSTLRACLISIPTLAVLPTLALLAALRRGASLSPTLSGALAGLGGGAAATALYALHCPEDHPLFFVTWYGTGTLIVMAAGALLGRRLLRW
jgi:hypothetical protein